MNLHVDSACPGGNALGFLPAELLYHVMENLDKMTLSSCSLVAHDWLEIARPLLFRVVNYCVQGEVQLAIHQTPPPLQDLLEFLAATPYIHSYIRQLSLTTEISRHTTLILLRDHSCLRGARLETLHAILKYTNRLQTLSVCNFVFEDPTSALTHSPIADGPAIEYLDNLYLDYRFHLRFIDGGHYCKLLCLLDTLGKVDLQTRLVPPPDLEGWTGPLKRAREIRVNGMEAIRYFPLFDFDHVESFDIDQFRPVDFQQLGPFIQNAGKGLRHLGFYVHGHHLLEWYAPEPELNQLTYLDSLDLSALRDLASISLALPIYIPTTDSADALFLGVYSVAYGFIIRTLSILSRTLCNITFQFEYTVVPVVLLMDETEASLTGDDIKTDWLELDDSLVERITRGGLETVKFVLKGFQDKDVTRDCVKHALPRTCATGAIQFTEPPEPQVHRVKVRIQAPHPRQDISLNFHSTWKACTGKVPLG